MEIKLVLQHPYPKACQHACIAMLAGAALEEVLAVAPSMPMSYEDRLKAWGHFGIEADGRSNIHIEVYGNDTPSCLCRRHPTILFSTFSHLDLSYSHQVLWHQGTLYDPLRGINPSWPWHERLSVACPVRRK